jgi:hypothetical protein
MVGVRCMTGSLISVVTEIPLWNGTDVKENIMVSAGNGSANSAALG